jgi:7-carboxy-7-deazaguanine synthase
MSKLNNSITQHQATSDQNLSATPQTSPLQINDLFWTLQGEGRWSGRRALFVRLPFCNYDCPWCDTEYNSFKKITEEEFLQFTKQEPARFAVITGGEPMAHKDLARIIMLLKKQGFEIACETNGSLPIPAGIDFPTVSPKRFTQKKYPEFFIHEDALAKAKELKYVVDTEFDFKILDRHNLKTDGKNKALSTEAGASKRFAETSIRYSLTPEYSTMKQQLPRILAYIKDHPQWQLNLQTHKWIDIP